MAKTENKKIENIKFDISQSNLSRLLNKLKDLSKINEKKIVVFKFETDSLILFSFVGKNFKNIYAFKNYVFKYDDIFDFITEITEPVSFISKNGIHLYHTMNQFTNYKGSVSCEVSPSSMSTGFADSMKISVDKNKLETSMSAGDNMVVGKDITLDDINQLMDTTNSLFHFTLPCSEYEQIKKMSTIVIKENDIITITVDNKELYIGESAWRMKICDVIDQENYTYTFPKRYFNTISTTSDIEIDVFDTYILTKYDDYNLMIVLETSVI
jgi:hypothetical protein